jgi:hypothetical protein
MRVYKFLDKKYGLKSLCEKRLKLSHLDDLNDPFELAPFNLTDPSRRQAFLKTKKDLAETKGILCFSSDWCDPVIWAHYSDKHRGLCLGFEIPDIKTDDTESESAHVAYIKDPLHFPSDFDGLEESERYQIVKKILFTKFKHWAYEKEIRQWFCLEIEEEGLYFKEFNIKMQLVEVIVGARYDLTASELRAQGQLSDGVTIRKARAAYDQFKMTADEDWNSQ